MIEVGSTAPDFSLRDQNNEQVSLAGFRGTRAVLVVFYPLAFTGICSGELARVQAELGTFENDAVQVVTISVDSVYAHKVFAGREGFEFPLLADFWPHGAVAQAFGVFDESTGTADRGTFLVDVDGVVRFAEHRGRGDTRDPDRWIAAIAGLSRRRPL